MDESTVSLLGGSVKTVMMWFRHRLSGDAFGEIPSSCCWLLERFLHFTAFLLFVANMPGLTLAQIYL